MLRLQWDDTTIVFHLKSAKIRNAQKILDSVLDEAKQEAIARLSSGVNTHQATVSSDG